MNTARKRKAGRKNGGRIAVAVLSFALAALSAAPAPALAEEEAAVLKTVGFGGYQWLLIPNGERNADGFRPGEGKATLFLKTYSEEADGFGKVQFNPQNPYSSQYQGSNLQEQITFKVNYLSSLEKALIVRRTLTGTQGDGMYDTGVEMAGADAIDQLLWPLSYSEYNALTPAERDFGFHYYLRSPGGNNTNVWSYHYQSKAAQGLHTASSAYGVRPAFWLDLSSALFMSDAKNKNSAVASTLDPYTPPEDDYKFTMEDAGLAPDFTLDSLSRSGNTLTVSYSGAAYQASEGEIHYFLSALVRDGDDVITHYGRLKAIESTEDESGSVEVTLPEGFDPAADNLYLFVEQQNGDYHTNFAGTPRDITPPSVGSVTPSGTGAPVSGSLVLTFSEPMDTEYGGTASLSGGSGAAEETGEWSEDGTVCTLPYSGLDYATEYTVTVSGFRDRAGNVMADDSSHAFTTVAAPAGEKPPGEEEPEENSGNGDNGKNSENGGNGGNSGNSGNGANGGSNGSNCGDHLSATAENLMNKGVLQYKAKPQER
ncbi:MAG: Ig-like domain-containing protein [Clostridium sp.]|jgi:hypothetical protein|nr:Ig-like domain-containing protein [Clostridium sp.]